MHPNEQLLRDLDAAQEKGDMDGFLAALADDVQIHMGGKSSLAGDFQGKDTFAGLFQKFMERTPEYSFEAHAYFADDEHGISLQRSHYKRGDETLDTNDVFINHFRDGKITEIWFLTDKQHEVDAFLG
jgi:ketosteroid isomerase-like protein